MDREIRVTGRGTISAVPDMICLRITISDVGDSYEAVVKMSSAMTELVRIGLQRLDFSKEDVKTEFFDVVEIYDDETDNRDESDNDVAGYRYIHCLMVEMPFDNRRLSACMTELGKCINNPEFSVSYFIKDPEAVKDMLLASAVSSARRKAETLAQAAGVTLGPLKSIDYSWEDWEIISDTEPVLDVPSTTDKPVRMSINVIPEEITLDDVVTVTWEIV